MSATDTKTGPADLLARIHALDPTTLSPFRRILHRAVTVNVTDMVEHQRFLLQHAVILDVITPAEATDLHEAWGL